MKLLTVVILAYGVFNAVWSFFLFRQEKRFEAKKKQEQEDIDAMTKRAKLSLAVADVHEDLQAKWDEINALLPDKYITVRRQLEHEAGRHAGKEREVKHTWGFYIAGPGHIKANTWKCLLARVRIALINEGCCDDDEKDVARSNNV